MSAWEGKKHRAGRSDIGNANWEPLVPCPEQPAFAAYVRNRAHRYRLSKRSTEPYFKRRPELIGKTDRFTIFKIKQRQLSWEVLMPSRNETKRAFERLRLATPIFDDASLMKLEEDVGEYLREAKLRDASGSDELISTVLERVARKYFQHILLKQLRVTPPLHRTRD
jgi:hypothetical protein